MKELEEYVKFCNRFDKYRLPKVSFKDINETYRILYREQGVGKSAIDKATFVIFVVSLLGSLLIAFLLLGNDIFLILTISFLTSVMVAYSFNLYLYKKINREEASINASIYFIKINFSLLQKVLTLKSDLCISFVKLMSNLDLVFSGLFSNILRKVQQGKSPEKELLKILTPSSDFNMYLQKLIVSNFNMSKTQESVRDYVLEKQFKTYLKSLEGKLAIVFFVGLFLPLGVIFFFLFLQVSFLALLLIIPIFLFLLRYLCRRFVKINTFFIGILAGTKTEKRVFDQFLTFLEGFAIKLNYNVSPEKAFLTLYSEKKEQLKLLDYAIGNQASKLAKLTCSFDDMIESLKIHLKNLRYILILDTIKIMIDESALLSSEKIFEILNLIDRHRKLEDKFEAEIKSQRFKVFAFIFLMPLIMGGICGMMPFFSFFSLGDFMNVTMPEYLSATNILNAIIMFITFVSCNSITCYYFLKVIKLKSYHIILLLSDIAFSLAFFISFMMVLGIG
ncbi:MAG: hypothetical protein KJI71_00530 [Patescibacteria group bacterium]|nr:hypothetical protein [Patescibacteria group bacterium]